MISPTKSDINARRRRNLIIFVVGSLIILGTFFDLSDPSSNFLTYTGDSGVLSPLLQSSEVTRQITLPEPPPAKEPITSSSQIKNKIVNTGTYVIIKKTGNESFFDVSFEEVYLLSQEIIEGELVNVSKKYINITFSADFKSKDISNGTATYEVPTTFNLYKDHQKTESKKTILTRKLKEKAGKKNKDKEKFKDGDKFTFSYLADPTNEKFLKFGENSIDLSSTILEADMLLQEAVSTPLYVHQNVSDIDYRFYYSFDHDNSTNIYDYTENNVDPVLIGTANPNATGAIGVGLTLDGNSAYLDTNYIMLSDKFTISVWVNPTDLTGGNNILFSNRQNIIGTSNGIDFGESVNCAGNGEMAARIYNGGGTLSNCFNITEDIWQHVATTYNGTDVSVFYNGVEQGTPVVAPYDESTIDVWIGRWRRATDGTKLQSQWWNGLLDEFKLINRSLSESEILEIYLNESSLFANTPSNITLPTFNATITDEDKLNVSFSNYERLQSTEIGLRIGEWNFTDGYDCSDPLILLCMQFDNRSSLGENDTDFLDSSNYGNNGTSANFNGDEIKESGYYHTAVEFDGTDDSIVIPDDASLRVTSEFSYSAWVFANTLENNDFIISKFDSDAKEGVVLFARSDGQIRCQTGDGITWTAGNAQSVSLISTDSWYHILCNFNGTDLQIYIDGSFDVTALTSGIVSPDTGDLGIGGDTAVGNHWDGLIDNVMIINRSLSAQEIKSLYIKGNLNYKYTESQNLTDLNSTDSSNTFTIDDTSTQFSPEIELITNENQSYSPLFDIGSLADYSFFVDSTELSTTINRVNLLLEQSVAEPLYVHQELNSSDVLLYMSFDHDNSTNIYDYSTYNNDGIVVGNATPNATGFIGNGLNLDGRDNNYVSLPDSSSLKPTLPISISTWVYFRSTTTNTALIANDDFDDDSDSNYFGLQLDTESTGLVRIHFGDGAGTASTDRRTKTGVTSLMTDQWYHIVAVVRGAEDMELYIDGFDDGGTYDGTGGALAYSSGEGRIGEGILNRRLDGIMDQVIIVNRSLTSDEVFAMYENQSYDFVTTSNFTSPTFNVTLTNQNLVNISLSNYERLQGTNISLRIGEWNFTDGYDCSDPLILLCMQFDNRSSLGENDTDFLDLSSYGNNGTSIGFNGDEIKESGKYHTALELDGTNDYIAIPDDDSIKPSGSMSISVWVNPASYSSSGQSAQIILGKLGHSPDRDYEFVIKNTDTKKARFDIAASSSTTSNLETAKDLPLDTWTHLVGVYDAANQEMHIYFNGVLDDGTLSGASVPSTQVHNNLELRIGFRNPTTSSPMHYDGLLDDLLIINKSLSAQEVKSLYIKGNLNYDYSAPLNLSDFNTTDSRNIYAIKNTSTQFSTEIELIGNLNNSYSALVDVGSNILYNFHEGVVGPAPSSSCGSLTEDTTLDQDVSAEGTCFTIDAHNITLNCNGFKIHYAGSTNGYGIEDSTGYENITINSCNIEGNDSTNSQDNIFLSMSLNANITGNNLTMTSDIVAYSAITLSTTTGVKIWNNNITHGGGFYGIDLTSSTGTSIESNSFTIIDVSGYATRSTGNTPDTVVENNTVDTEGNGFIFEDDTISFPDLINISGNNFSGAQQLDNIKIGAIGSETNRLTDQIIGNFSFDTYLIVKDTTFGEIDWFTHAQFITLDGSNWSELITFGNGSVFIKASQGFEALNLSVNISMYNSPASGIDEPLIFRDGVYCPTEECFNFTAMESATLIFNSTSGGNFTIQSNVSGDLLPPNVTDLSVSPPSPVIYSPSAIEYNFTTNVTDATLLDTVLFEFEGVNYTGSNTLESRYNLTVSKILGVGTYNVRISANDSSGNVNNTEVITLVVNQATPEVNLTLNSLDQDISIVQGGNVNITGFEITGDSEFIYTRQDESLINNGTSPIGNITTYNDVGTFIINLTYPTSQNYSTISESHIIIVNDTTNPNVTDLAVQPASPVTYIAGAEYNFTANITDNVLIDTVLIELLGVNYTATNNLESNYNLTFFDLPAGTHIARFSANDSSGNVNNTETITLVINQATVNSALRLNTSEANYTANYPNIVNASATSTTSQATITLLRDGVDVTTNENHKNISLAPGTYNYTGLIIGNQNFTNSTINRFAVINLGISEVNLTLNGTDGNINVTTGTLVNSTGFLISGDGEPIYIYLDTGLQVNGTSPVGNITNHSTVGIFTYNLTSIASENFTTSSETHTVTVADGPDAIFPNVTDLTESPSSPAIYSVGARYEFNATVTDETAIDTVRIEFNGTSFPTQNFTATASGGVFNFSAYDLGVGTYSYRWFANDTNGNINNTEIGFYTVNQAAGVVSTFLDGSSAGLTVNNNTNVNMSGQLDTGIGEINLLQEGVLINNGTNFISNVSLFDVVGSFQINTTYGGNENFTGASEVFTLTITLPPVPSGLNGGDMIFGYNIADTNTLDIDSLRFGYTR